MSQPGVGLAFNPRSVLHFPWISLVQGNTLEVIPPQEPKPAGVEGSAWAWVPAGLVLLLTLSLITAVTLWANHSASLSLPFLIRALETVTSLICLLRA